MGLPVKRIRLVIIERQAIFLEALISMFREYSRFEICASTTELEPNGISLITSIEPDVALINMVGLRQTDTTMLRNLVSEASNTALVVLADRLESTSIKTAFENGVLGYFLKEQGKEDLFQCLDTVALGKSFMSPKVADLVLSNYAGPRRSSTQSKQLTHREKEIVSIICQGVSNKACARKLGLSVKTIEKYRANSMQKLELSSAAELTTYAIRSGLVEIDRLSNI